MLVTGTLMITPEWEYFLQEPAFYIKMGLVAVLIINALAIGKLSRIATELPFTLLTTEEKRHYSSLAFSPGSVGRALH